MWVAMGEYADLVVHDVLDEIVDMAAPRRQGAITLRVRGARAAMLAGGRGERREGGYGKGCRVWRMT